MSLNKVSTVGGQDQTYVKPRCKVTQSLMIDFSNEHLYIADQVWQLLGWGDGIVFKFRSKKGRRVVAVVQ